MLRRLRNPRQDLVDIFRETSPAFATSSTPPIQPRRRAHHARLARRHWSHSNDHYRASPPPAPLHHHHTRPPQRRRLSLAGATRPRGHRQARPSPRVPRSSCKNHAALHHPTRASNGQWHSKVSTPSGMSYELLEARRSRRSRGVQPVGLTADGRRFVDSSPTGSSKDAIRGIRSRARQTMRDASDDGRRQSTTQVRARDRQRLFHRRVTRPRTKFAPTVLTRS